jgi:hypothetical protein
VKNLKGTRIFYRNFFAQKTIPNRFSLSLPHTGRVRESRTLFLSDAALSCLHLTVSYVMGPALLGGSSSKLSKHSFERRRRRRRETPSRECVCAHETLLGTLPELLVFFQTRATFYILRAQFGKTNARRRV